MRRDRRISLLRYWTVRYLMTLCLGLLVIGVISSVWLQYSQTKKRLEMMTYLAEEIADRMVDREGRLSVDPFLFRLLEQRQRFLQLPYRPLLIILDQHGNIVFSRPPRLPAEVLGDIAFALQGERHVEKITLGNREKFYLVSRKIENEQQLIGWVILLTPAKAIAKRTEGMFLLAVMLGSLALLGWGVIYLLTRKLSAPIHDVAEAAKQIVAGNYHIQLDKNVREKEIYELLQSFKEMADRLRQLETMRAELLAGVTHELKTPVTAISGLLQAVKDGIVTGEEAKEFIQICAKETTRLQKMLEDLLDFNSFAAGAVSVHKKPQKMNELVQEIAHQWLLGQEDERIRLSTYMPCRGLSISTDPFRVQQILYNLLNNAKQAMEEPGEIAVSLYEKDGHVFIDVKDEGHGIPEEEQPLVFERFFRGKEKKQKVRGLGLGLTFSKMIARSLGGDLFLKESSPRGTTFTLVLPGEKETEKK